MGVPSLKNLIILTSTLINPIPTEAIITNKVLDKSIFLGYLLTFSLNSLNKVLIKLSL